MRSIAQPNCERNELDAAIAHAEAALPIYEQIESPVADHIHQKLAEWRPQRSRRASGGVVRLGPILSNTLPTER